MASTLSPSDEDVRALLNMHKQLNGQAPPDAPPELKVRRYSCYILAVSSTCWFRGWALRRKLTDVMVAL